MGTKGAAVVGERMARLSEREQAGRRLFEEIGDFLHRHRLDPTPANFALVHLAVTRSNEAAAAAVKRATSDGIRLSQADADRIMAEVGAGPVGGTAIVSSPPPEIEAMRLQMDSFAAVVDQTHADAQSYGRDLRASAAALNTIGEQSTIADLVRITSAMLERTQVAERALSDAVVETRGLRQKLADAHEQARSDLLTNLLNRRAFEAEFDERSRSADQLVVALCDIDYFKLINDNHGHAVGDRVLKVVAQMLRDNCGHHTVARYGGEEFVILFAEAEIEDAQQIVENARLAVASRQFRVRETDRPLGSVSFSAGIAAVIPGESRESALRRADTLLYKAKADGRNRVECELLA